MTYYEAITVLAENYPAQIGVTVGVVMLVSALIVVAERIVSRFANGSKWAMKRLFFAFLDTDNEKLKPIAQSLKELPEYMRNAKNSSVEVSGQLSIMRRELKDSIKNTNNALASMLETSLVRTYYDLKEQAKGAGMNENMLGAYMRTFDEYKKLGGNGKIANQKREIEVLRDAALKGSLKAGEV